MSSSPSRSRAVAVAAVPRPEPQLRADDLYVRHGQAVLRYCRSRLRSTQEAEDALQTTFLRVFVALEKGVVPEYELAWLFRIAHNVCMTKRLAAARRAQVETACDLDELGPRMGSPERERTEEASRIGWALRELPENLRRAFLLREWQGLSYAEIAETLGVSIPAVESLIFRARRALAEALRPRQEPELEPLLAA